jgi:hypothetical protein
MNTIAKLTLAVVAAATLLTSAAKADDREGGPGVVLSQEHVLGPSLGHDAQGE